MINKWTKIGNNYYLSEVSQQIDILPPNIFKLNFDPRQSTFYLSEVQETFDFPYKTYGIEKSFIDRVMKSFTSTKGNMGILLSGVKGTGKTVTAQMIANKSKLPVIIIHEAFDGIPSYLNNLQQDVVIFFDEYEKMYNNYDHTVLTVMDGVLNTGYRKLFLLTTNSNYHVNENMLQRPGRIRYVKYFDDLQYEHIVEIVDDILIYTQFREETIDFISKLDTITIDIVKSIIQEVNIHCEPPFNFKDVFNIKTINDVFNVYKVNETEGTLTLIYNSVKITPAKINSNNVNHDFRVNDSYMGNIKYVEDDENIIVDPDETDDDGNALPHVKYKLEKVETKHKAFKYAF